MNSYLNYVDISPLKEFFLREGNLVHYAAGDVFQEAGAAVSRFGYLLSGSVRYQYPGEDGRVHTVGYAFDEAFIGEYSSFLLGRRASRCVRVAEESDIYVAGSGKLEEFIASCSENSLMFRKIAENLFVSMQDRVMMFYVMSPEERYLKVVREMPLLLKRISLKELASFIGVTPEALSRIRKRLASGDRPLSGGTIPPPRIELYLNNFVV